MNTKIHLKVDAMRFVVLLALPTLVLCANNSTRNFDNYDNTTLSGNSTSSASMSRYGFYRKITWGQELSRNHRPFGSVIGNLSEFPAACALLNEHLSPRCSAAVVAPRWAVTAGHCSTRRIAFLLYNAQHLSSSEGDLVKVLLKYRHPEYQVEERDDGEGLGVDVLLHDVGLVYVEKDMKLNSKMHPDPLLAMKMYRPDEMKEHELQVMGYAHISTLNPMEDLFSVKMRMVNCTSLHWFHCICGVPSRPSSRGEVSVCLADSGGPVLYRGVQVALTSMGPLECESPSAQPPPFATSVFTVLYPYANLINDTIHNTRYAMQMIQLSDDDDGCVSIKSRFSDILLGLVVCYCIRLWYGESC